MGGFFQKKWIVTWTAQSDKTDKKTRFHGVKMCAFNAVKTRFSEKTPFFRRF
jgi:hypothetical protein